MDIYTYMHITLRLSHTRTHTHTQTAVMPGLISVPLTRARINTPKWQSFEASEVVPAAILSPP